MTLTFASWNQIAAWLRQRPHAGDRVGLVVPMIEISERLRMSPLRLAVALLRRVGRNPYVVVCENCKKERL